MMHLSESGSRLLEPLPVGIRKPTVSRQVLGGQGDDHRLMRDHVQQVTGRKRSALGAVAMTVWALGEQVREGQAQRIEN
jgi:hypothetical protein